MQLKNCETKNYHSIQKVIFEVWTQLKAFWGSQDKHKHNGSAIIAAVKVHLKSVQSGSLYDFRASEVRCLTVKMPKVWMVKCRK